METIFTDRCEFSKQSESFNFSGTFTHENGVVTNFNVGFNKIDGGLSGNAVKTREGEFIWNFFTVEDFKSIEAAKAEVESLYAECMAHIA